MLEFLFTLNVVTVVRDVMIKVTPLGIHRYMYSVHVPVSLGLVRTCLVFVTITVSRIAVMTTAKTNV